MNVNTRTQSIGICLLVALAAGCGSDSSKGKSSSSSATAPATSSSTTPTGGGTGPAPGGGTGSGGTGGISGEFTRTYQGRSYRLYVPDTYQVGTPAPLAVFFHGAGDSSANFYNTVKGSGWTAGARAEAAILVVPDTKSPTGSFPNWSGNPNNDIPQMEAEFAEVLALVRDDVATRYNVDSTQLHAAGFSDGGLFVAVAGIPHADVATSSIFGYGWGAFYPVTPQRKGPVHMACGTNDQFFNGAQQSQAFLTQQGHDVLWEPVNGVGHLFSGISAAIGPSAAMAWMTARPHAGASTTPGTTPTTPPATGSGSGGTGGGTGTTTVSVNTTAQAGLPSIAISYDVYVPANYTQTVPAPVVFAANMGSTPWRAIADAEGVIVVDFRDHDRNGGFNFNYDVLGLNAILTEVEVRWNVDTQRRYYHGFSAGAHWGYVVVLANANSFAALGVNAGSMNIAIQQGVWPGQVQRKIPVAIRHGVNDTVVPVQAGRDDRARLQGAGHPVQIREFNGGHTISAADAADVWGFLKAQRGP
jgi:predicted peptidase